MGGETKGQATLQTKRRTRGATPKDSANKTTLKPEKTVQDMCSKCKKSENYHSRVISGKRRKELGCVLQGYHGWEEEGTGEMRQPD